MSTEPSSSLMSKAFKVSDLVHYQPAAVVSRVILKGKSGNVTLFAFDAGQELSEHTAPFDAMATVIEGEVEVTIAGSPMRVSTGEMVIMPANQPHALKAIGRFKMMLTMIRG